MINLAIDGGQSALRLRVLPDGRTGHGPGYQHGPDSFAATVEAIRIAARDAGVAERVGTIRPPLAVVSPSPSTRATPL